MLGISYILLRSPYVQTALVKYVTERIEQVTGVKMQIGGVEFRPMSSLVLNDVLLRDFKNDTLVFCENLKVKADSFSFVNRSFTVREMTFNKACFNLYVIRGDSGAMMNIEMFIDSLRGKQAPEAPGKVLNEEERGWLVGLRKVSVRNSRFTYREDEYEPVDYGVNWTDVDCRDLNVDVSEFHFGDDYTGMRVTGLNFIEKSGLAIRQLDGKVAARADNLLITEGKIALERSLVDLIKLEFNWTPNQHDWRNFTTKMQQYYEIGPSYVSFIDLAYFNGVLRGINNTVKCSGVVSNTINQLEGHDLYFELGDKSVFQGQFKSSGLPKVWNTLFDIEMTDAHLNPDDLESVYLPWFNMNIPVPSPLHQLEYVDFSRIHFNGSLEDFTVTAQSNTPALTGDLKFIYKPCEGDTVDCSRMYGDFNFNRVNYGRFTGIDLLGTGGLAGTYSGKLDTAGTSFNVKSKLNKLNVQKGQLRDIDLFLSWEGDKVDLLSSFDNENARGNVVMSMDTDDSLRFWSVRGGIDVADLEQFGFSITEAEKEGFSTSFDLVSAGNRGRSFSNLSLSDFNYRTSADSFNIEDIGIEVFREGELNTVNLNSEVLDLALEGTYQDVRPLDFALNLVHNYLPAYADKKKQRKAIQNELKKVDLHGNANIKDANRILKVMFPDLSVSPGSKLFVDFRNGDEFLDVRLNADTILYQDFCLLHSGIRVTGNEERLQVLYSADRVRYADLYELYNVRNELGVHNNHVDNKISWCNWGRHTYSGELKTGLTFIPAGKNGYHLEIGMEPGVIVLADSVWHVRKSKILIEGKQIAVENFSIGRDQRFLSVNGKISENPEEKLSIDLNQFDLSELNRMIFNNRFHLFGLATGNLTVQDYYNDRLLASDFDVKDWGVNRDTLGSLRLRSYWDADSRSVIIGAENRVGEQVPLTIAGYYIPGDDSLNVDIRLAQVGLERLNTYASEWVSETSGGVSGRVNISGTALKPDISGSLQLDSVIMKVNALNSKFFITDKVHIVNNRLLFNNFAVKDINGNRLVFNGGYEMQQNKYDLQMQFQNFMFMNTAFSDNDAFYGRVFLSGLMDLNNRNGQNNITVTARTENNSKLFIPLTETASTQANNFLHFVNTGQQMRRRTQVTSEKVNINLDANLEVNDNLEVDVVFDPTVGDVLHVNGTGDIKVVLDKDGGVGMFGEYRISKGNYQFTLSNLVNKNFVLKQGGTIAWNGAPYDATLNISAVYNIKTSLTELLPVEVGGTEQGFESQEKGRKVPVECILNLSDNLVNPLVKFDINFPTLESQTKSYVQSLFSSQDEINKQMFALLVMGKFYRTDENDARWGDQARMAGVSTVTEMISSQLSRWLSQISNRVDIGLAYRVADHQVTTDEIEVALSTQLLNDRITLSANGNMDVGNTTAGNSNTNNIAGDFDLEVKLNRQGTLKMKAYSHTDEKLIYNNTETIQGVGVSYQESFDTLRELMRKYLGFFKRKKNRGA